MKISRYAVWVDEADGPSAVFGGLSGQLVLLRPGEAEAIRRFVETDELGSLTLERAQLLVQSLVLVPDDRDEREVLSARYNKAKYNSAHLGLTLVTSLGCNFDCPYCYESKHPSLMGPDVQAAVLQMVDDGADRLRSVDVTWMGGEPLVGKKSLFALSGELIDRCDRNDIAYSSMIVTNGWLLDGPTAKQLVENRCTIAQVTLDGPPDVHDKMRPYVGGGPTFWGIIEKLHQAIEHIDIAIRVNIDESNLWRSEELLQILADEGFGNRLTVHPAKMTYYEDNDAAPVASYTNRCYSSPEFAKAQLDFDELAQQYGLGKFTAPQPAPLPCMAVAANAIVVGSDGEVWKCWDDIGNPDKQVGDVRSYLDLDNDAILPWLTFEPVKDEQCRDCIALPTCQGGCLHHTLAGHPRDAQCGTFRFNHKEQIRRAAMNMAGTPHESERLLTFEASELASTRTEPAPSWTPVSLRRRSSTPDVLVVS